MTDGPPFELRLAGEMGERVRQTDWRGTPLGDIAEWSDALKQSVGMILASGFPMALRWGPALVQIYNDAYRVTLGDKHPAAFGRPLAEVWPEIYGELGPLCEGIMRGERPGYFSQDQLWRIRRHGDRLEDARFTISYSPIPDPSALTGIGGVLVTAIETTDQYRAQQQLRSRNRSLSSEVAQRTVERDRIWQISEDLLGVSNFDGYFTSVSPAWTELLGWSEDELLRMHVSELRHPDDAAESEAGRAELAAGVPNVHMENRFRRKDGAWRWLAWTLSTDETGLIYLVGRDITVQKAAIEALKESELHFRLLVDGVIDYAIYMLDPTGIVSSWNSGAQRIKGYREDEVIGRHFSQFYTEEDRIAGVPERALAQAAGGMPFEAEGWRVRKDGSRFWASVTLSAIRDHDGTLVGFAKVTRDVTERRQSQEGLRRAQERLAQSQKLETLGQLTGAIAHDFNNLLMVVGANTQLVKRRLVDPPSLRAVEAIEHAASRGETLTRRLLTFSRRQNLNPIVVDLRERLAASRDVLATSAGKDVELVFELPDAAWPVMVDVPELELALVNIMVNARDAMPDGGTIRVAGSNVRLVPDDGLDDLTGDFVALRISDTGTGIDPDILPRVFEPFFTTKGPDKGTGLGLSQVYGFARQSNGTARVTSGADNGERGTTVTIYLPRAAGAVAAPVDAEQEDERKGGAEHILLVEDNQEVQEVTAAFLEELGYQVSLAENADAALERLAADKDIRLVFSDIVMPGAMNGITLARRVRSTYPHIAVLLTTGYAPQQNVMDDTLAVLRKPYRLATLSTALRDTLDRARHANRPRG
ncbi:MAG TPA: PAS domain S-box protein [Stellaceae bacterium]|nr:PAS domain S-box protein [Stellaceae bacterium]